MQETTTYQAILGEGRKDGLFEDRIAGEQRYLILLGIERFGKPDVATLAAIEAIRDIERLEALGERILEAEVRDWNTLLGAP